MAETLSDAIWRSRFRWSEGGHAHEPSLAASWDRLALAVSAAEPQQRAVWQQRFRDILDEHRFLPSRQLLHSAGAHPHATLASCLAIAPMADSLHGVFDALHDSAIGLHAGADLGVDFSNLLPSQWPGFADAGASTATAPYVNLWAVARGLLGQGNGHAGTVSMSMRCDHPDIESFIDALPARGPDPQLQAAVLVSDTFMRAVQSGSDWPLLFPLNGRAIPQGGQVHERVWPGSLQPQPCLVHRHTKAQSLWVRLLQAQRTFASPRLLFADTMQRANSLWYGEQLYTANPGASVPLSADAACIMGNINLTRFVRRPPAGHADLNWDALKAVAAIAVRFLDDAYDVSAWPSKRCERRALGSRRLGLGVTGLASLFAELGVSYGSQSSLELTEQIMVSLRDTAYQMSTELAREKGSFGEFDAVRYAAGAVALDLPHALQDAMAQHGMRNSHVLAVGPDVLLDQLAGPMSHSVEPLYTPGSEVPPEQQLELAARVQACVDGAVSVTVQVPKHTPAVAFEAVLQRAWSLRLKNCLVQRQT